MAEQEQTAVLNAEPTDATTEPTLVAEAVASAAEAVRDGAEAAEPKYDLSTQEGIMALRQSNAAFDAYIKQQSDSSFSAGRQKAESEMRMKQGDKDVLNRWERDLLAKRGINPDDLSDEERAQARYLSQIAAETQRIEVAKTFVDGVMSDFNEQEQANIRLKIEQLEQKGDLEAIEAVRDVVIDTAYQRRIQSTNASLKTKDVSASFWDDDDFTPDSIPAGSKAAKKMREWLEAEVAKEAQARGIEGRQSQNPPRVVAGNPAGDPIERLQGLSPQERVNELIANPGLREQAWERAGAGMGR